jgi:hypothetical protein
MFIELILHMNSTGGRERDVMDDDVVAAKERSWYCILQNRDVENSGIMACAECHGFLSHSGKRSEAKLLTQNGIIHYLLNPWSDTLVDEQLVFCIGICPVGEENKNNVVIRIGPRERACEAAVTKRPVRNAGARRPLATESRLIESQRPAIILKNSVGEGIYSSRLEKFCTTVAALIQQHLQIFRQIVGIAEQAGMRSHPSQHRNSLIMNGPLNGLHSKAAVFLRWRNSGQG